MNILSVPQSGSITFSNDVAGASTISLSTFPKLYYDGAGALGVSSTSTALTATDKFKVDAAASRLFTISDATSGSIFDITNAQGLPLCEVYSTAASTLITMGTYGTNAFVVNNDKTGLGTASPNEKLTIIGGISATGNASLSGITASKIGINTAPSSYTLDVNGTANFSNDITGLGKYVGTGNITTAASIGIGTTTPNEKLTVVGNISATGGLSLNYVETSVNYTATANDYTITTLLSNITVQLPACATVPKKLLNIKNLAAGYITVSAFQIETIDNTTYKLLNQYDYCTLQSRGLSGWIIR